MQKPMTLEELMQLQPYEIVWEERRRAGVISLEQQSGCVLALLCAHLIKEAPYVYGKRVRAWRRLPTEEELAAAEWEV